MFIQVSLELRDKYNLIVTMMDFRIWYVDCYLSNTEGVAVKIHDYFKSDTVLVLLAVL